MLRVYHESFKFSPAAVRLKQVAPRISTQRLNQKEFRGGEEEGKRRGEGAWEKENERAVSEVWLSKH